MLMRICMQNIVL